MCLKRVLFILLAILACVFCWRSAGEAYGDVRELHRPILAVWSAEAGPNGESWCSHCDRFWADYKHDVGFRKSLQAVYRVVYVNADQRKLEGTLLRGITGLPTFVAPGVRRVVGYTNPDDLLQRLGVPRIAPPAVPPPPAAPEITPENVPIADSAATQQTPAGGDSQDPTVAQLRAEAEQAKVEIERLRQEQRETGAANEQKQRELLERLQHAEAAIDEFNAQQTGRSVPLRGDAVDASEQTASDKAALPHAEGGGVSWWRSALTYGAGALWGPPGAAAAAVGTGVLSWWFGRRRPAKPAANEGSPLPSQPPPVPSLPQSQQTGEAGASNTVYTKTQAPAAGPVECSQCQSMRAANRRLTEELGATSNRIHQLTADLDAARQESSSPRNYQVVSVDRGLELARRAIDVIARSEGAGSPSFARWQKLFEDHVRLLKSGDKKLPTGD